MSKTILLLLDACGFEAMQENAGFLELLKEKKQCAKYRILGELPSLSRPMYETILTGLPASKHTIVSNLYTRPSKSENIFKLARKKGLITAAAAYNWMSELYNENGPFSLAAQRFQLDGKNAIQYGIYYSEDDYPDTHVYADAEFLRKEYSPDFLLIHPMNIDYCGHKYGSDSVQYKSSIMENSECLSLCMEQWVSDGYQIVITADHGMDTIGLHGGNLLKHREVPLYIVSDMVKKGDFSDKSISQLVLAPLLCKLLGMEKTSEMVDIENNIKFCNKS